MARVLIASPTLLLGGTEVHIRALAEKLVLDGHAVRLVIYHETDPAMVRWMESAGVEIVRLGYPRARGLAGHLRLLARLTGYFRRAESDLVHVQYLAPGLVPILAARLADVPVVFGTVHTSGAAGYGWRARMLLQVAARFCTEFFCVSQGAETFWFGGSQVLDSANPDGDRRHHTIYNGVDTEAIAQAAGSVNRSEKKRELGIPAECPVIGFLGRLASPKGMPMLLAAMAQILMREVEARLLVVGDGPDRIQLEALADRLGLKDRVIWLGAQAPDQVAVWLGVMDVLAAPSVIEGFGLMAAEAMAAGVPVVASRIEGLTELVIDGETGFLVQSGDPHAMADAIVRILVNPEARLAMGAKGFRRVVEHFSRVRFDASWSAAYNIGLVQIRRRKRRNKIGS